MSKKVRKAVIPAAGLGTRVLPASKAVPKEMLPIVDKPAIQYIVEEAVRAGIEDILIITNRGKGVIEDHFDHVIELEQRLEAGGKLDALRQVREITDKLDAVVVDTEHTALTKTYDIAAAVSLQVLQDALLASLASVTLRVGIQVVWVDLERHKTYGAE